MTARSTRLSSTARICGSDTIAVDICTVAVGEKQWGSTQWSSVVDDSQSNLAGQSGNKAQHFIHG
jgi:hypothetical protein